MTILNRFLCSIILMVFSLTTFAWERGVSAGFGIGQDTNYTQFENSGVFLSGDFMTLTQNRWIHMTLNGALGGWHTTSATNNELFTAAVSLAMRFYPFENQTVHPFIIASAGPAYVSTRQFNFNKQGANVNFQTTAGVGVEIGKAQRFDINLRLVHFSNAGIFDPNEGYNFLYVLSVGYLF